jgi:8-amino-7-oxononanoate synthase
MPSPLEWIPTQLDALRRQGLYRQLRLREGRQTARATINGREVVNFGSNDYLGLAGDPRLAAAIVQAAQEVGWGSGASALVTGYSPLHQRLEQRLAEFEATEATLLFTSGFAANAGTIAALVGPGDTVFTDRKNHASLLDGCRLSRADVRPYPHLDCPRLKSLLDRSEGKGRRLIVTDSLFSMDGDLAPLGELADLAEHYDAMLMVDEAHATGVFGRHGRGVAEHLGVENRIHVRIGTLSKALGCVGGFAAGSRTLIDWLLNRARPYVFSTAAPPATAAAALAAVGIVESEPQRRQELLARAATLRETLVERGWNVGRSTSQIIPIILGQPEPAIAMSAQLWDQGLFVPPIRPPTVPEGEACLRISLSSAHSVEMIAALVDGLDHSARP